MRQCWLYNPMFVAALRHVGNGLIAGPG